MHNFDYGTNRNESKYTCEIYVEHILFFFFFVILYFRGNEDIKY